ncbi:heterokaryon incompatibility protein-domain-containing protein [Pyrenochaeta sp. MPI-SDFR-AT-0127]|nr:heterokaryon incompatibility protein-domain-containing protein [Pyrenochaeta sp. MPI-SDFR-AT-0127]
MAGSACLELDGIQERRLFDGKPVPLCSRCADLDINQLWSSTGPKIALGSVADWNLESCVFCKFLGDVLSPIIGTHRHEQHKKNAKSEKQSSRSYYLYSMKTRRASMRLLQILEPRIIVLSHSEHGPPPNGVPFIAVHPTKPPFWLREIGPLIDFEQPKEWLRKCTQLHAGHCSRDQHNDIAGLRLIDCRTGEVTKAKATDVYVALSYVWGRGDALRQQSSVYPQTILDAITVTQNLGYTRLWVDKYCIDQEDQLECNKQLQQMDAIYQQAVVTLIAAAGTDADYGLPGVTKRFRPPNLSVKVHQQSLSAIRGTPDLYSDEYKWTSRAWTFQEGLLSTRRLVFTDDQLYFECQGFYCIEMLDIPMELWEKMHHREKPYLHSLYRIAPHMGIFPLDGCGVDPWDIYKRINEYSKRSLTFPNDILRGMLGIFRAFERGEKRSGLHHLYGTPFPKMALSSPNKSTSEAGSKRVLPTFSESLRWTLEVPSKRREGFPSWSWTGWFGTIEWPPEYTGSNRLGRTPRRMERPRDPKVNENAIRVSVGLRDDTRVSWESFQTRYRDLLDRDQLSGIVYLEAYTTPAVYSHDGGNYSMSLSVHDEDGQSITLLAKRTTEHNFKPLDTFLAIHFYRTASGSHQRRNLTAAELRAAVVVSQHVLIVRSMGSHWERVAYGTYEIDPNVDLVRTWQCLRLG